MHSRPTRLTQKKRATFLELLAEGHTVKHASEMIGVTRAAMYWRRNADEALRTDWDAAIETGTDALEQEARRRAVEGVPYLKRTFDRQGNMIDELTEIKYSDTLLIFLLKGRAPEKYKDRHELAGPKGGPIGLRHSLGVGGDDDFDYAAFQATFVAAVAGGGTGGALVAGEGCDESVDTAPALPEAVDLPHGAGT